MTVILYRDGRIIHLLENGRAIFRWTLLKGGEQVAFFSDTVHSNLAPECVLVDVTTGKQSKAGSVTKARCQHGQRYLPKT
jgi:hypothetical protein